MSTLKEPKPVYLFIGLIFNPSADLESCMGALKSRLGALDFESPEIPFEGTSYYSEEMGEGLKRKIITFDTLIPREKLKETKILTTGLEEDFAQEEKRTINIDPGYVAQEHVILATGKGFSHRPYLGSGVYADLTLIYRGDEYNTLEWTYPDYGTQEMRSIFQDLRKRYVSKLPPD